MFDNILDNDETIVEVLRPSKAKVVIRTVIILVLWAIFLAFIGVISYMAARETGDAGELIGLFVAVIVFVLLFALQLFCTVMWYKKTYYAYTNKRLIIRTGVIGVDFRSLDIKMIGATDVYVSLFDKIVKNTGTLRFGSMSSPINNTAGMFAFAHICNPYENYKKIKEHIEACKQSNSQNIENPQI